MVLEFRRDCFKRVDVLVSDARAKRPRVSNKQGCPFCRGSESMTPPTICAYPNGREWRVRRFRNAFPALKPLGKKFSWRDGSAPAAGDHDVIVETEKHAQAFQDFSLEHLGLVWRAYKEAFLDFSRRKNARLVFLFRNRGPRSGASIPHEHAQIVALPYVPEYVRNEAEAVKRECPFCGIAKREAVLFETENFVCILPKAARLPCESWIVAKRHVRSLTDLSDAEGVELLEALQEVVRRTAQFEESYNVAFHSAPRGRNFHLHVEIYPRKPTWGAIELGLGLVLNTASEKRAASILHETQ